MNRLRRLRLATLYYVSFPFFAVGALALNLLCTVLLLIPRRHRPRAAARRMIRAMFEFWVSWLEVSGLFRIDWPAIPPGFFRPGVVYVANHPTLIDATILLARLPDATCIFKPALLRNPVTGPAAVLAGYIVGDQGVDTIREAARQVAAGRSLLIFPEGTRTRADTVLNPLRPGFALIARRARAPIHVLHIEVSAGMMRKGSPWRRLPPLPATITVTAVDEIAPIGDFAVEHTLRRVRDGLVRASSPES